MRIEILHNVTTEAEGRHAPFARFGTDPKASPGDKLVRVGEFYSGENLEPSSAAEFAFAAGNDPDESKPSVIQYRSWKVRSLSIGDVVVVHHSHPSDSPWSSPMALSCESSGWRVVDLGDFDVKRSPNLTHEH